MPASTTALGAGNARNMTVLETQDRTRIIIALSELVGYSAQVRGSHAAIVSVGRDLESQPRGSASGAAVHAAGRSVRAPVSMMSILGGAQRAKGGLLSP